MQGHRIMRKSLAWLSGLVLLTLTALAGLRGWGSRGPAPLEPTPAPTVAEAPAHGRDVVQLTLRSPRSRYLVGEPVDLRIELTNVSEQTFRRYDRGDEYLDQLQLLSASCAWAGVDCKLLRKRVEGAGGGFSRNRGATAAGR